MFTFERSALLTGPCNVNKQLTLVSGPEKGHSSNDTSSLKALFTAQVQIFEKLIKMADQNEALDELRRIREML